MDKFNKSVNFVARHYRADAFKPRSFFFGRSLAARWRRWGVAASVAVGVLTASACFYTFVLRQPEAVEPQPIEQTVAPEQPARLVSQRIEFTDAPLTEVVAQIELTYDVTVENIPTAEYRLTLSYEGTADDLISTINMLLGTALTIK